MLAHTIRKLLIRGGGADGFACLWAHSKTFFRGLPGRKTAEIQLQRPTIPVCSFVVKVNSLDRPDKFWRLNPVAALVARRSIHRASSKGSLEAADVARS